MVLKKLKLSVKCDYNDNKEIGECLRHIQCEVITFVMVRQKFVITIMIDIELMEMVNLLAVWWKDGPEIIEITLFLHLKVFK